MLADMLRRIGTFEAIFSIPGAAGSWGNNTSFAFEAQH